MGHHRRNKRSEYQKKITHHELIDKVDVMPKIIDIRQFRNSEYWVSNTGLVYRKKNDRLKPIELFIYHNYVCFVYFRKIRGRTTKKRINVHRAVCEIYFETFDLRNSDYTCHHINGNTLNNCVTNLFVCSREYHDKIEKEHLIVQSNFNTNYKIPREDSFRYMYMYRETHKQKLTQYKKEYYITNRDKISQYSKEYRENNKEKIKEKNKKYIQENSEKIKTKRKEKYILKQKQLWKIAQETGYVPIKDTDKRYWVNRKGSIISIYSSIRELNLIKKRSGYLTVNLGAKKRNILVHRLVAEAFIPNPENKPQVDHINRVRDDNRVENLRWATAVEQCENRAYQEKIEIFVVKNNKLYLINRGDISKSNYDALLYRAHKGETEVIYGGVKYILNSC